MCVIISSIKRILSNQSHYFPDMPCTISQIAVHTERAFFLGNRNEQRKGTVPWKTATLSPLGLEHSSAYLINTVFIDDKEFALRIKDSVPFHNRYTRTLVFPRPAPFGSKLRNSVIVSLRLL